MRNLLLLPLVFLAGCGLNLDKDGKAPTTTIEMPLDAVKLITPSIEAMDDSRAYFQSTYEIGPEQRLLLRYEKLAQYYRTISTDAGKNLSLRVTKTSAGRDGASPLKLCPLTRNWTMHATWRSAHPFGANGVWQQAGGDYASSECLVGQQKGPHVSFEITRWYIDHSRGKEVNWGLILTSDTPVTIRGEKSGEDSPRLFFETFVRP